jgi:hypothetical protein
MKELHVLHYQSVPAHRRRCRWSDIPRLIAFMLGMFWVACIVAMVVALMADRGSW